MNRNTDSAIEIKHLNKFFYYDHKRPTLIGGLFNMKSKHKKYALNDVSLTIKKGEKVGLVGTNGSGKTSLLKLISGISSPNSGSIKVNQKVVSIVDLEAGFHPDLSGRENILLNGMIIGMSKNEVTQKIEEMIDFSGIREYIDSPFFTYSSGMKLRLAFSVAIVSDPDILILDEVLAVGDISFQTQAHKVLNKLFKQKKTIVVASHWLDYLERNVNRIIHIDKGRIVFDGSVNYLEKYKMIAQVK